MATNLGGLPTECYICCRKPRKLQAISLRRFGALLPLVRFAQPAEVRLRSALVPPFAQNDIQWFYLVVCVRKSSRRPMAAPTMNFNVFVGACIARPPLLAKTVRFRDAEDVDPYKRFYSLFVGAIHESPVFYTRYAFVLGGRRAPALQTKSYFIQGGFLTIQFYF